jgi:hypothetical protein
MEVAFFTEGIFRGKVLRNNPNMRTDLAWICSLEADHYNLRQLPNQRYDLGIVITPKKNPQSVNIEHIRQFCDKVGVMQEGPHWYFQDYTLDKQIHYFNNLLSADIIFVHNEVDRKYYKGLTNHNDIRILPTLMIEDLIKDLPPVERKNIMIGGNFCQWYGGFDSYIVAQELDCPIYVPTMGRKVDGEEQIQNLNHLPYMKWVDWIKTLNNFKYGVHLMRTHAAGTFALNCAFLGIPCIGYEGLDTQEKCHPNLTVKLGDIKHAKKLLNKLSKDLDFYQENCILTKRLYNESYSEKVFRNEVEK